MENPIENAEAYEGGGYGASAFSMGFSILAWAKRVERG
jgi:hypothetical protein